MNPVEINHMGWLRERASYGADLIEESFATWAIPNQLGGVNGVVGCRFDPETYEQQIDTILRSYQAAVQPANFIFGPSATPAILPKFLRNVRRCMGPVYLPGMELDLTTFDPPKDDFMVAPADWNDPGSPAYPAMNWYAKAERKARAELQALIESRGNATTFLCFQGASIASQALVFVHEGIAGIYDVMTKPEFRNQGCARAAMHKALLLAKDQGCKVAILQSHKKAVALYEKMGFRATGDFKSFYYSRPRMEKDRNS